MATIAGSGVQSATVTTEHTLLDINTAGVYQLYVNLVNMVALDYLELRTYKIFASGGTRRVTQFQDFSDAQPTDGIGIYLDPIANALTDSGSLRFSLKQVAGTSRNFEWEVIKF